MVFVDSLSGKMEFLHFHEPLHDFGVFPKLSPHSQKFVDIGAGVFDTGHEASRLLHRIAPQGTLTLIPF